MWKPQSLSIAISLLQDRFLGWKILRVDRRGDFRVRHLAARDIEAVHDADHSTFDRLALGGRSQDEERQKQEGKVPPECHAATVSPRVGGCQTLDTLGRGASGPRRPPLQQSYSTRN